MILYGLKGLSHGGANLMTVMSAEGRHAVLDFVEPDRSKIHVPGSETGLPQYHEMIAGGLDDLVARYGIDVLDFHDWTRKKAELGANIYR